MNRAVIIGLAALSAIWIADRQRRRERAEAKALIDTQLHDFVTDINEAARSLEAYGISSRRQSLLLRRYFGASALRTARQAEAWRSQHASPARTAGAPAAGGEADA